MIKAKINRSVAAVALFTVILTVAWFVFFISLCSALGYLGFSTKHFGVLGTLFTFDFAGRTGPMILAILSILFIIYALIMSIRITIKRKRKSIWFGFVFVLLGTFIALELFFNLTRSVNDLGYVYILSDFNSPTRVLMSFGAIGTGALAWLLSIILFFTMMADVAGKLTYVEEEKYDVKKDQELEEVVRRIVKEEIEKRPVVNQYFYGVGPEEPIKTQEVVQVLKEQPKPEPKPEPKPQVVEFVAPAPAPQPVEEEEKNKIIRIPFDERLVAAEKDLKDNYNELKNEILSYGVKSRLSNSGDTFRLHRKTFVKISIAGKGLKLYFALDPKAYADSTIPVLDVGDKGVYEETPLAFKVKSVLSVKRAKQLIADVMATENLEQGEVGKEDYVKEVRALLREQGRL